MPSYKVVYFDFRGRAEIVRLTLAQAGQEFEDVRVTKEQWAEMKPNAPSGQLPYMEVDGRLLGQSMACARYIAKEHGLLGGSSWEEALINQAIETSNDVFEQLVKILFAKTEEDKVAAKEKITVFLQNLEKLLNQNDEGAGFFVGKSASLADLSAYVTLDWLFGVVPEFKAGLNQLKDHFNRVANLPRVKQWLQNRPHSDY